MVAFGNIIIPNDVFLITVFSTFIFIYWFVRRLSTIQPTKVMYEDKDGDATLFTGDYKVNEGIVKIRKGKETIEITKRAEPRKLFIPPFTTWKLFRAKAEEHVTLDWGEKNEGLDKSDIQLSREGKQLAHSFVQGISGKISMSLKNPMYLIGIFTGVPTGMVLSLLLGVSF